MKAGDFVAALRELPVVSPLAFTGGAPIVVLSPHPDDESLGLGGLIAASRAAGCRVHVVVVTDGAGSHPRSRRYPPERLVALRRAETDAAGAALGLDAGAISHLGLPDTQAPSDGAAFEAAVEHICATLAASGATALFVTWGHDPHCDHEAADAMARAVRRRNPGLALWSYPIWGLHLDPETSIDAPSPAGVRLDIAPWQAAKRAAIAAHASQMTALIDDDPDGFRFTPETLAPFLGPFEPVFAVPL